jgi:hypothetical protein
VRVVDARLHQVVDAEHQSAQEDEMDEGLAYETLE